MAKKKPVDIEAVEARLAALADSQAGGSVQDLPQVARQALIMFRAFKHQAPFQLILEQAAK